MDAETAIGMLAVFDGDDGPKVHTFRGTMGADWSLDRAREVIEKHGAELAPEGSIAAVMGHCLYATDDVGPVAFATKGDVRPARTTLNEFEKGWLECLGTFAYTTSEPWAESGVQYVGTTGCKRRDAAVEFLTGQGFSDAAAAELAG